MRDHLTEDEIVSIVYDETGWTPEIEEHLEGCTGCTARIIRELEIEKNFPMEKWQQDRKQFVADLRKEIFGSEETEQTEETKETEEN